MERVALITGAAGGLGQALVREFAARSWRVIAGWHRTEPMHEIPDVTAVSLDVTNRESVSASFEQIERDFGRLDVLINNAGVNREGLLAQADLDDWDQVHQVNLGGPFLCTQAALPLMLKQGGGHILNISSFAGRCGSAGQSAYAASKAALLGFTQSVAREYGRKNIRVNAILPGVLPTGMTRDLPAGKMEQFRQQNVLGRLGELSEVAEMIVALAGTRHVSGQIFQLDSRISRWS